MENHKADQLILHIGLAKTGSTALQDALFQQRDLLFNVYQTLYPGEFENHFYFQAVFTKDPEKLLQIQRLDAKKRINIPGFLEKYTRNILAEILEKKPERIIISSEYFSGMTVTELKEFRIFLESITRQIILFAYVRDPWSYAISYIQEMIRTGYLRRECEFGYVMGNVDILDKFETAFGRQVDVVPYLSGASGFNTVDDFCQRFGFLELQATSQDFEGVNRGMNTEAACMLLVLNQFYPKLDEDNHFIEDLSRDWMAEIIRNSPLSVTPIRMSTSTVDRIYEESKQDIDLMENKYFGGRKPFTELYQKFQTKEFNDKLSIARLTKKQITEYLLSCLQMLSNRAVHYYRSEQRLTHPKDWDLS